MIVSDKYLIVVSLTKGRNFPGRNRSHLLTEAKFDGEVLCTDPVPHSPEPEINQELAWELDRKGLQQHRLQRTSIKLLLYAVDNDSPVKESVGYVLLDVRSAASNKTPRWYPVLHSKYAKLRPEISIAVYLDEDGQDVVPVEGAVPPKSGLASSFDPKTVRPTLHNDGLGAYYQIGSEKLCRDTFILSLSLFSAGNLFTLLPSSIQLSSTAQGGFHFHYNLLGSPVNSENFGDLLCSEFPAERFSVRIRSSADLLRVYFTSQEPKLMLQLVCGDTSLGKCEIPLFQLVKSSHETLQQPAVVEGLYTILSRGEESGAIMAGDSNLEHEDNKPWVALSVIIRREKSEPPPVSDQLLKAMTQKMQSGLYPPEDRHDFNARMDSGHQVDKPGSRQSQGVNNHSQKTSSKEEYITPADEEVRNISERAAIAANSRRRPMSDSHNRRPNSTGSLHTCCLNTISPIGGSEFGINAHRFCYTIELRSILNMIGATHPLNVYARYVYPLFGSAAPLITHPPVSVRGKQEVNLPQGFCAFEFAANEATLKEHLSQTPLLVEVYSREKARQEDELIGVAEIPLLSVMLQKSQLHTSHDSLVSVTTTSNVKKDVSNVSEVTRRVRNGVAQIMSHSNKKNVGELSYHLSLEDFGLMSHYVSDPNVNVAKHSQRSSRRNSPSAATTSNTHNSSPILRNRSAASNHISSDDQQQQQQQTADLMKQRQASEFQAAMELELWKEEQEKAFKKALEEKERTHMMALAEEWARRDKEREIMVKRKVAEYQELEETLQATLRDLAEREKRLEQAEMDVSRQRQEASREHASVLAELRSASQRVQTEGEQKLELEREKTQHWKQRAEEWQQKFTQLDKEFTRYRDRQEHSTEAKLQTELAHAKMEVLEMEKRLDEIGKAKMHYKQMWAKAMKELARMKQRSELSAREQLKRQEMELEHMRLRYLGNEEAQLMASSVRVQNGGVNNNLSLRSQELEAIKKELDSLRNEAELKQQQQQQQQIPVKLSGDALDRQSIYDEHVAQLIEERDNLLRTGVYSTQDDMIVELDRQIRHCLENGARR